VDVAPSVLGAFEVDTRSGELRRQGLAAQSCRSNRFRCSFCLLEHPGEVITREELTKKLWRDKPPSVDFDRGLNKAINRLREVLRDSAEKPRFISKTLPHRGYSLLSRQWKAQVWILCTRHECEVLAYHKTHPKD